MVKQSRKRENLMAKLSKTNTYAILWLNGCGYSVEQIVEEIDVTEKQVLSVLEQNPPKNQLSTAPSAKNLMITHTSGKKLNNVAIMTKDASAMADENRKTAQSSAGRNQEKNIFRPNK